MAGVQDLPLLSEICFEVYGLLKVHQLGTHITELSELNIKS